MGIWPLTKRAIRIAAIPLTVYLGLVAVLFFRQREMLFFPTHGTPFSRLAPWSVGGRIIGYCREVPNARAVWFMTHGNGGQAADRDYVLTHISEEDSLYVLEYPGYGGREGKPCMQSMNQAASDAYRLLRSQHPEIPVCVIGESIGSGPACSLAWERTAPDKIVLVVPFDTLASVASERYYYVPVRLLLRDAWDNVEALKHYAGPVDIFGAAGDDIIPVTHAKALASAIPRAHFVQIPGGHNDWAGCEQVKIGL